MRIYDGNAQLFTGVVNCFDGFAGPIELVLWNFCCTAKKYPTFYLIWMTFGWKVSASPSPSDLPISHAWTNFLLHLEQKLYESTTSNIEFTIFNNRVNVMLQCEGICKDKRDRNYWWPIISKDHVGPLQRGVGW